jgi:hypothetical protein
MSDPTRLDPVALDRWITGNYGEDQFKDEDETNEDEYFSCARPGRHGCGYCDACDMWAEDAYEASLDDMT